MTSTETRPTADLMGELDRVACGQILIPQPGDPNFGEWLWFKDAAGLGNGRDGRFWNPQITGAHGNRYRLFANKARHGLDGSGNYAFADLDDGTVDRLCALLRALRRDNGCDVPWELREPDEGVYGPEEPLCDEVDDIPPFELVVWAPIPAPIRTKPVRSGSMSADEGKRAPRLSNSDPELVARARELAGRRQITKTADDAARVAQYAMVAELRQAGWGYDRIANALGMTKARVQQLCR